MMVRAGISHHETMIEGTVPAAMDEPLGLVFLITIGENGHDASEPLAKLARREKFRASGDSPAAPAGLGEMARFLPVLFASPEGRLVEEGAQPAVAVTHQSGHETVPNPV